MNITNFNNMSNNLIWITNVLTTKIYKEFPDKYVLITALDTDDFNINDIILYRRTPKTYIRLGKVIAVKNKKIIIHKLADVGNHSKPKMIKILSAS